MGWFERRESRRWMERLRRIDCPVAIGGHGPGMTRARMAAIAEAYLRRRG